MYELIPLLSLLIGGHFICDFPLQTDNLALGKNRNTDPARFGVDWQYWLSAHSATHAVAVGLITQNAALGLFEFFAHSIIDMIKCDNKINLHQDQLLHILCKIGYVYYIFS